MNIVDVLALGAMMIAVGITVLALLSDKDHF